MSTGNRPGNARQKSAVFGKEADSHITIGTKPHQKGAHGNLTEADNAGQRMNRDLQPGFPFNGHLHRFSFPRMERTFQRARMRFDSVFASM